MKKFFYSILVLSILGAIISGVLTIQHYYPTADIPIFSCGDGIENPCIALKTSGFASIYGMPIAAIGVLFYLFIIFTLLIADYAQGGFYRGAALILFPLIAASLVFDCILFAILIYLQRFCPLCFSTYCINSIICIAVFLWIRQIKTTENAGYLQLYRGLLGLKIDEPVKKAALASYTLFILILIFSVFSWATIFKVKTTDPRMTKQTVLGYLEKFYSAAPAEFTIPDNGLILGNPDAELTIFAFTDFLCSACNSFYTIEKYLLSKYRDKIKIVYYNFPLELDCNPGVKRTVYANSCIAARSVMTAEKLGIFKEYIVRHFSKYDEYNHNYQLENAVVNLQETLKSLGKKPASKEELVTLMNSKENSDILADHVKKAESNGINATPTIYINDRKIEGVYPQEVFDAIINVELKKNDQEPYKY